MDVSLTPGLEKLVNSQVEGGSTARQARLSAKRRDFCRTYEKSREAKLEALRREIARSVDQADRGELIAGDEVFDRLRKKNDSISREK